jgi:2,3-bisphosphoglycerate-independent phosphoglycerate mutase
MKVPTTLIILDGFAIDSPHAGNAIAAANTPVIDELLKNYPNSLLSTSGKDVGLPDGTMGNSEVGHMNIGAGRIVYQSLLRITNSVDDGSFFENEAYISAIDEAVSKGAAVHLFILLSDVGVHSDTYHLWAALELCRRRGAKQVYVHCFTDGRDSLPTSGEGYMRTCALKCSEYGAKIATVMGRFYAMDRDKRWDRTQRAYDALVFGEGTLSDDPVKAVLESYEKGITDEFIEPIIVTPEGLVKPGDTVIHLNFRPDRARQLTRAFVDEDFNGFERRGGYFKVNYVCTAQYDEKMPNVTVAFPPEVPKNTFGEFISRLGMTQLRIAETEKYAHVTFFFNGGVEKPYKGEDRVLIPSSREFATYDKIPEMKAYEVCEEACNRIQSGRYDAVIMNFANCDMVGHTGVFEAAVKAVEVVDECLGQVLEAVRGMGGIALVTADHGNADRMLTKDGSVCTSHTLNPVPFIVCGADVRLRNGRLSDIIPTMLELMGLEKPPEMTGESLILKE